MRRYVVSAVFLSLMVCNPAFSQGGNAQLGGVVTDPTSALLPGVTVTATNTETSVTNTVLTNESGAYTFPSLQPGKAYRVTASLPGFQTRTITNLELGVATTNRQDFKLAVAATATTVEVSSEANSVITAAGASVGDVLPDYRIRELPIVGNNVLSLLDILPGLRQSANGEEFDTIAGLGTDSINVTRDGLSTNDNRYSSQGFGGYGRGVFSSVNLPPDLVGEIRLILTPVDAELGRGNSQIQIQTRSGTNRYTGSAVWNIQNTALNANTWTNNHNVNAAGEWEPTTPDWRNQNHFTFSFGGPVFKNKTFFFALWDQNISNTRETITNTVLTDTARLGIMRYWTDWNPNDAAGNIPTTWPQTANNRSFPSVNDAGVPVRPTVNANNTPYTGELLCFSVFGDRKADGSPFSQSDCAGGRAVIGPAAGGVWDPFRLGLDSTGYIGKMIEKMPHANRFRGGDGLNTAQFRWLRGRSGSNENEAIVGADSYTNRKQINLKLDQNFKNHRISGNWTYQRDDSADNVAQWPDGLTGAIYRRPQILTINATSTLSSTLLNEFRFGVNYNQTDSVPAWFSPKNSVQEQARALLFKGGANKNGSIYDVVVNPSTGLGGIDIGGYMSFAPSNIGNVSPLWQYSDTVSWTHSRHSFKFGGELRLPRSNGYNTQPYPSITLGNPTGGPAAPFAGSNYGTELPLFLNTVRGLSSNLTYLLNGSIGSASHQYWIENQKQVDAHEWVDTLSTGDGSYNKYRDQVMKEWSFFAKDDYKLSKSLTLNLGLRWEYFASPYLRSGLSSTLDGQGDGVFGAGRGAGQNLFNTFLMPGNLFLTGYGTNPGTNVLTCLNGVQQSALLPRSTCDPALLSQSIFVGPNTVNPDKSLIPADKNNFGPAVGFAWQVPFFGEGKTTVRGGYQITYGSAGRNGITIDGILGSAPGNSNNQNFTVSDPFIQNIFATRAMNLTDVAALVPVRPTRDPGAVIPIYARSVGYTAYDPKYATPYTQNFNLSVTRSLRRNMTLDVRYIGTMAKKQAGSFNLNDTTVYHNPELFEALRVTRAGGDSPLFDQMLAGINLNAGVTGYGPVGTVVNGVLQTGSAHLRRTTQNGGGTNPTIAQELANGNFDTIINRLLGLAPTGLQTLPINPATGVTVTGVQQRVLRNGCDRLANGLQFIGSTNATTLPAGNNASPNRCFPEDFFVANPQLNTATYNANLGNNKYHSVQVQFTLRPTAGFNFQTTYSWAKGMELPASGYIDPWNRRLDYRPQSLPPHDFRMNGGIELPFGPNKLLLGNSSGWLARVVEKWQTNIIFNARVGEPMSVTASRDNLYGTGRMDEINPIWREGAKGEVRWNGNNNAAGTVHGGTYFGNPSPFISVPDPQCSSPSVAGPDALGANLRASNNCSLDALGVLVPAGYPGALLTSTGESYIIALQNPEPGKVGTLGTRVLQNFGRFSLDASVSKAFQLTESKNLQLRIDSTNILNHPTPVSPSTAIDTFGNITGMNGAHKTGSRTLQAQLRFNF